MVPARAKTCHPPVRDWGRLLKKAKSYAPWRLWSDITPQAGWTRGWRRRSPLGAVAVPKTSRAPAPLLHTPIPQVKYSQTVLRGGRSSEAPSRGNAAFPLVIRPSCPIRSHNWPHNATAGRGYLFAGVRPSRVCQASAPWVTVEDLHADAGISVRQIGSISGLRLWPWAKD